MTNNDNKMQDTIIAKDFTDINNYEEWLVSTDIELVKADYDNKPVTSGRLYTGLFNLDGSANF